MKSSGAPSISALSYGGLTAVTADGRAAMFAILDEDGNILAAGKEVAAAAWTTSINAYRQFLVGLGHLRVHTKPDGLTESDDSQVQD